MSELIKVPSIGGEGEVIEILIAVGDRVEVEQSLVTLESDKASMEIPCPKAGVIKSIKVQLGDKLKEGDELIELELAEEQPTAEQSEPEPAQHKPTKPTTASTAEPDTNTAPASSASTSQIQSFNVPDIGEGAAQVIELLISPGDRVEAEQSLLTLESDKASMEIPAPAAGIIESIAIQLGQQVKTGDPMLQIRVQAEAEHTTEQPSSALPQTAVPEPVSRLPQPTTSEPKGAHKPVGEPSRDGKKSHAGPAVRKLARELGVELPDVQGSGPHQRILKEDLHSYVQSVMRTQKDGSGGMGIPPIPEVDFSRFGDIDIRDMTRLQQIGAVNLHRSWLNVPHVTQFDLADISELEEFRKAQQSVAQKAGVKLTVLPFLLKACAHLLREQPNVNVSLAPNGKQLIQKNYVHLGFAVDTPDGLLVPVIRDVDKKSLLELAAEAAELADRARNKKLNAEAMQGACFTISSLGHIGGTYFTPIVNSPEVALLGVSRATMQPVWDGQAFQPRLMLPLSLSYDHRAINGAAAAQFTKRLGELLADIRTMLL